MGEDATLSDYSNLGVLWASPLDLDWNLRNFDFFLMIIWHISIPKNEFERVVILFRREECNFNKFTFEDDDWDGYLRGNNNNNLLIIII